MYVVTWHVNGNKREDTVGTWDDAVLKMAILVRQNLTASVRFV